MTGVLRRRETHRDTGRRPCDSRGRDWGGADVSQGMPRIASNHKLGRGKEGFFPRAFRESMFLLIL